MTKAGFYHRETTRGSDITPPYSSFSHSHQSFKKTTNTTDSDLPAGQRSPSGFQVQTCSTGVSLQGELALQSCGIDKGGGDEARRPLKPPSILKLNDTNGGMKAVKYGILKQH